MFPYDNGHARPPEPPRPHPPEPHSPRVLVYGLLALAWAAGVLLYSLFCP